MKNILLFDKNILDEPPKYIYTCSHFTPYYETSVFLLSSLSVRLRYYPPFLPLLIWKAICLEQNLKTVECVKFGRCVCDRFELLFPPKCSAQ